MSCRLQRFHILNCASLSEVSLNPWACSFPEMGNLAVGDPRLLYYYVPFKWKRCLCGSLQISISQEYCQITLCLDHHCCCPEDMVPKDWPSLGPLYRLLQAGRWDAMFSSHTRWIGDTFHQKEWPWADKYNKCLQRTPSPFLKKLSMARKRRNI